MKVQVIAHPEISARIDGRPIPVGETIDLEVGLARDWIRLGIARPAPESAALETEETAVQPRPAKRQRPRRTRKGKG